MRPTIQTIQRINRRWAVLFLGILGAVGGCTTAPMTVHEIHYFKIGHGDRANYYRLIVDADTRLGVSEYRSGWFPARSVDSLFGDVSTDGGVNALRFRANLEGLIETNVLKTTANYLAVASDENADLNRLQHLAEARRRVLAYPRASGLKPENFEEMNFDPARGLVKQHGDEKLVFIVSSNPDEVVGKIASFSESSASSLTIQNLAQIVQRQLAGSVSEKEGAASAHAQWDALLVAQMTNIVNSITNYDLSKSASLLKINSILTVLHSQP